MQRAIHTLRVRAPPERVWALLSDPARIPEWVYGARKIEFVTHEKRSLGAQWRQTNVYGPIVVVQLMEITREEAMEAFDVETVTRPRAEIRHRIEAAPEETGEPSTRFTIEMEYELPFGGVVRAAEPTLGGYIGDTLVRRSAEGLKRLLEARPGTPRSDEPLVP